jgi:hypothetical protein
MVERSNRLIAALAVACFAAAFALTPSEVRSRLSSGPAALLATAGTIPAAPVVADVPAGDPFAARAPDDDLPSAPALRPADALPARLDGRGPMPLRPVASARVGAVAVGAHPEALVDDGGHTRLVTVGDRLDGAAVTAIDDGGITLADGRRLVLAPVDGHP